MPQTVNILQERLQRIAQRHPQAEIARKTGVTPNSVSRYMRGTRMPLDFGAALVDKLGVNPNWLLAGDGAPFLADVTEDAGRFAEDLLEVVQAMNVVAHMRIGSLGGKHHLRTLRELSDALARHDELHQRLNRHSVPILRSVLEDLRDALDKPDLDRAEDLAKTAEQLGRFCDDEELAVTETMLRGRLEMQRWNLDGALKQTRKALMMSLRGSGWLDESGFEAVVETVHALLYRGMFSEARRIADAAFAVASNEAARSPTASWLTTIVAEIQVHSGELRQGIQTLADVIGRLTGLRGRRADGIMTRAMMCAGNFDTEAAIACGGDCFEKAQGILGITLHLERNRDVALAVEYWDRVCGRDGDDWKRQRWADLMLRILNRQTRGVQAQIRALLAIKPGASALPIDFGPIIGAQLYRLTGNTADAKKCFRDACKQVERLPDWFCFTVMWQARHMRNALELGTRAQQKEAREWFERHVELGYRCFADLVEEPSGAPK